MLKAMMEFGEPWKERSAKLGAGSCLRPIAQASAGSECLS